MRDELAAIKAIEQAAMAEELEMIRAALDASMNVGGGSALPPVPGEVVMKGKTAPILVAKGDGIMVDLGDFKASGMMRNSTVTGTLTEDSFQLSIGELEDPLLLKLFPGLVCHALPQLGIYGPDYTPFDTMAVIKMPVTPQMLHRALPGDIWATVSPRIASDSAQIDYVVMVHDFVIPESPDEKTQGPVQINVISHPWVFANTALEFDVQLDEKVEIGLFHPFNVISGAGHDVEDKGGVNLGGPVRFGGLGFRQAMIHNGSFSPNNAQFSLTHPALSSFFLVCCHENRVSISFNVIPGTYTNRKLLKDVFSNARSLQDVVDATFDIPQLQMLYMQLRNIIFGFIHFEPPKTKRR
eukprot:TRINITY_DN2901_c0_g2_i1.p1 TRINITY_DN2901_c0_g2~~TRINITY_DN2901_c0_g2_i1.p1  ORF type:complete len:406 (-),score=95.69 TRINITY_DN2901_c0_g2_i1:407-1468(-)